MMVSNGSLIWLMRVDSTLPEKEVKVFLRKVNLDFGSVREDMLTMLIQNADDEGEDRYGEDEEMIEFKNSGKNAINPICMGYG